ncbi:MAG: carboxylating nicotinate-nucleotide diphosphorylase [Alphaproteobacteria bacterium]|nr:carboxylating nicotinate-nucleotide diphosphorylase [Alphaproteobacteria bacterium]
MQSPIDITALLRTALTEDIGSGDLTGNATIPAGMQAVFAMHARQEMVVCGLVFLPELFAMVDATVRVDIHAAEGEKLPAGTRLATLSGPARALLAGERVALNLVQQLSGVATLTQHYVAAVVGTQAKILDTRKTVPGMRHAQKYAVTCGGGVNHRMGLYDAVLIKDNHIAVAGGVTAAVRAAREYLRTVTPHLLRSPSSFEQTNSDMRRGDYRSLIEVECDTLAQLEEALAAGVDSVLLDNMSNAQLCAAVAAVAAHNAATGQAVKTEASGNVSLQTVRAIAQTGVDFISVGKLTHSAVAVDIGLDEA